MEKSKPENQPTESGNPDLAEAFEGLMRDWKEGRLTYDKALEIYTAKALAKYIKNNHNGR